MAYRKEGVAFLSDLRKSGCPATILMKTLSVFDAQKFFSKLSPNYYLFATSNQPEHTYSHCFSVITKYREVVFSWLSNRVCFKNGDDSMCFNNVKCVRIDDKPSIGTPFYIVCSDNTQENGETVFTFMAD